MSGLFWATYAALWLVLVVQGVAFLEILRQVAAIHDRLGPERPLVATNSRVGDPLPRLAVISAATMKEVSLVDHLTKPTNVLLLLTPRCPHCYAMAHDLTDYADRVADRVGVAAIIHASLSEAERFVASTGLAPNLAFLDPPGVTSLELGVNFAPGAVLVEDGRLGPSAVVNSVSQVETLIDQSSRITRARALLLSE